jgi:hypothetical protein
VYSGDATTVKFVSLSIISQHQDQCPFLLSEVYRLIVA